MSTESWVFDTAEQSKRNPLAFRGSAEKDGPSHGSLAGPKVTSIADSKFFNVADHLSSWSASGAKRAFDCLCVVALLPLLVPVCLAVAMAVRLTSSGPVLFLQERIGRHGKNFTILKFRTMLHTSSFAHRPVTTTGNQRFTSVGPFLRRWKLDELPQLLNVLTGDMSLVGPRPKMPEHAIHCLSCRPGITGAATIAFAREESVLSRVSDYHLESFYHSVILPAKLQLDARYMAQATFHSDLELLVKSVLRRWDSSVTDALLRDWAIEQEQGLVSTSKKISHDASRSAVHPHLDRPAPTGEVSGF